MMQIKSQPKERFIKMANQVKFPLSIHMEKLKPYFIPDKRFEQQKAFWIIYDHEIQKAGEMRKCIDCLVCQDSCHSVRNPNIHYTGPRNVVKAIAQDSHPRNGFSRAELLQKEGIGLCNVTRWCSRNCPQDIRITEHAIIPMKEKIITKIGMRDVIKDLRGRKHG